MHAGHAGAPFAMLLHSCLLPMYLMLCLRLLLISDLEFRAGVSPTQPAHVPPLKGVPCMLLFGCWQCSVRHC
jgi:hypothetical protein